MVVAAERVVWLLMVDDFDTSWCVAACCESDLSCVWSRLNDSRSLIEGKLFTEFIEQLYHQIQLPTARWSRYEPEW